MLKLVFKLTTACLLVSGIAIAEATVDKSQSSNGKLNLTITNVSSDKGNLVIQIFDKKKDWLEDDRIKKTMQLPLSDKVKDAKIDTEISLPVGEYAIFLFHDLDKNKELKTNWIGIPREPVGTSNNAKGRMGPPKYKDAAFKLEGQELNMTIKLADL